jgi:hypothetical protein
MAGISHFIGQVIASEYGAEADDALLDRSGDLKMIADWLDKRK